MLKLPNSIEPAVMAENILHLRDVESSLDGRVSALEVTAPKDYSTTETATGQKWTDGKDIYSIALSGTFPTITTTGNVELGSFENNLIRDFQILIVSGNTYLTKLTIVKRANNTIAIQGVGIAFSEADYSIVLYYTKPDPAPGRAPEDSDQEPEPEPEEKKTAKKKTTK